MHTENRCSGRGIIRRIFKVRCADGKYYALKCYTRLPRHAAAVYASLGGGTVPYLVPARFLPDEIYLFEHSGGGAYYPVTLMEWVEGESLGGRLARLCRNGDRTGLKELAGRSTGWRCGCWNRISRTAI